MSIASTTEAQSGVQGGDGQAGPGAWGPDGPGGETILLVEDEPAMMRLATKALEARGYHVLGAHSPSDAIRLAEEHSGGIHLLLSDVVMPGMNGRDLGHALLNVRPTLKALFMSGHTADVIAIRGLLAPGVAFIEKPFTPVALSAKVREVLDGELSTRQLLESPEACMRLGASPVISATV